MKFKKILSSETTEPISTKLCWNDPWVVPFQNCARQHRPISTMAAITKIRKLLQMAKTALFQARKCPNLICISIMMSYCHHLAFVVVRPSYVVIFFKNLLLWNYWANLNQTLLKYFLDGPLPKLCPVIPTSNQDGHQAKNRKKRGWNLKNLLLWNYWANLN